MTGQDIADYLELVRHEYNWICAICLCPAQAGIWLEFKFIEFPHHPLLFDINQKAWTYCVTCGHKFNFECITQAYTEVEFGCLGHIDVVQAIDLQNQTTSFFLDEDMARSK